MTPEEANEIDEKIMKVIDGGLNTIENELDMNELKASLQYNLRSLADQIEEYEFVGTGSDVLTLILRVNDLAEAIEDMLKSSDFDFEQALHDVITNILSSSDEVDEVDEADEADEE